MNILLAFALLLTFAGLVKVEDANYQKNVEVEQERIEMSKQTNNLINATADGVEEQRLREISLEGLQSVLRNACETTWINGRMNGCADADRVSFAWAFLPLSSPSVTLSDIVYNALADSSSVFSCTNPKSYENYLILQGLGISTAKDVPAYFDNVTINVTSTLNPPAGYTNPCGFIDLFYEK